MRVVSHEISPFVLIDEKDKDDADDKGRDENALTYDQLFALKIEIFFEMFADDIYEHWEKYGSAESSNGKKCQNEKVVETVARIIYFFDLFLTLIAHAYNEYYDDDGHAI